MLGALALTLGLTGLTPLPALAQQFSNPGGGVDDSNGVFQLEGNTSTDAFICFGINSTGPIIATPGAGNSCPSGTNLVKFAPQTEDWDKIFAGTSTAGASTGIINDKFNDGTDNIYTGGSTKDTNDFSQWLWKNGKPQSKDDFEHAYAAAYNRSSDNHTIVVAGVDRYDNSGSATAGFWFVQDPTVGSGVTTTACTINSGCAYGGTHKDGDFLIISQFSVGGAVSTIQVFVWSGNGAGGSITGPVTNIGALGAGQCDPRTGDLGLCGTVNGVPVLSGGWGFTAKHSTGCSATGTGAGTTTANCMDVGEFLEVGLDLTGLFQTLKKPVPCISTFFAESRSSGTGITSTLSDFVGPAGFPLCGISDTKTCNVATIQPDGVHVLYNFSGSINNVGIGTLTSVTVADVPNGGTGFTNLVVCEPASVDSGGNNTCAANSITAATLTAKGTATSSTTYNGSFETTSVSSTLPNTATASGITPEGVTLSHNASWLTGTPPVLGSNCVPAPSGMLSISKTCSTTIASGSPLTIEVNYSGTLTNNANVQVSNITIVDSSAGSSNASAITITCGTGCTGSANGSFTLAPGGMATYSGSFDSNTCTPNPMGGGRCAFTDTVTAAGTGALGSGTITSGPPTQATCNLCPNGTCAAGN